MGLGGANDRVKRNWTILAAFWSSAECREGCGISGMPGSTV
jgi:hypothetical protein